MQSLASALGLRASGLAAACTLPLVLTALLFAGPLLALAHSYRAAHRVGGGTNAAAGGTLWRQRFLAPPLAVKLRNWVVSGGFSCGGRVPRCAGLGGGVSCGGGVPTVWGW